MSFSEYEDAYNEALRCLAETHEVGQPQGTGRSRVCSVDGRMLNDEEILDLWWGKDIASQIREELIRE